MAEDLKRFVETNFPKDPIYSKEFYKTALPMEEMMDYPHFFKQKKANLANGRKLKIRSTNNSSMSNYPSKQNGIACSPSPRVGNIARVQSVTNKSKSTARSHYQRLNAMGYDVHATGGKMSDIITNQYMNNYVEMLKGKDVQNYIDKKMKNQKPIFKNFIENNANIRRK